MVRLNIITGVVQGYISEGVFSYPFELFESKLADCIFPIEDEPVKKCLVSENFHVFPNPSVSGRFILNSLYEYDSIRQIRIFTVDGRLVSTFSDLIETPNAPIEIEIAASGLYLLEIVCDNRRFYKKVIVAR